MAFWELNPYRFIIKLNSRNIGFLLEIPLPIGEADEVSKSALVLQTRLGTLSFSYK